MSTAIGWVLKFFLPSGLKALLDAVPKGQGTILMTFLATVGIIANLAVQAAAGGEISENEIKVSAGALLLTWQQYYQRRASRAAEKAAEGAKHAAQQATVAAEQTIPVAQARHIAESAVIPAQATAPPPEHATLARTEATLDRIEEKLDEAAKK